MNGGLIVNRACLLAHISERILPTRVIQTESNAAVTGHAPGDFIFHFFGVVILKMHLAGDHTPLGVRQRIGWVLTPWPNYSTVDLWTIFRGLHSDLLGNIFG